VVPVGILPYNVWYGKTIMIQGRQTHIDRDG